MNILDDLIAITSRAKHQMQQEKTYQELLKQKNSEHKDEMKIVGDVDFE